MGSASSSPPSPAAAAAAAAGLAHGGAFGGLSNCLLGPLPLPSAVTARFPPARRAVRRRAREGAGRAAATLRSAAAGANQEIHFRVARAPFCEAGYKEARGVPPAV